MTLKPARSRLITTRAAVCPLEPTTSTSPPALATTLPAACRRAALVASRRCAVTLREACCGFWIRERAAWLLAATPCLCCRWRAGWLGARGAACALHVLGVRACMLDEGDAGTRREAGALSSSGITSSTTPQHTAHSKQEFQEGTQTIVARCQWLLQRCVYVGGTR